MIISPKQSSHIPQNTSDTYLTSLLFQTEVTRNLEMPWGESPKKNQANCMNTLGINTPRIFETLSKGIEGLESMGAAKGYSIYFRSEHPDDGLVNARSGLLESLEIRYVKRIQDGVALFYSPGIGEYPDKNSLIQAIKRWMSKQAKRAYNTGYNISKLNFSTWEGINGDNYTIVSDSSDPDTYFIHPIRVSPELNKKARKVMANDCSPEDNELIDFYNQIQRTNRFGKSPIVEVQRGFYSDNKGGWTERGLFFLQALQTTEKLASEWTNDSIKSGDEFDSIFVRGVTPPEGMVFSLTIIPPGVDIIEPPGETSDGIIVDTYGETGSYSKRELKSSLENVMFANQDMVLVLGIESQGNHRQQESKDLFLETLTSHTGVSALHKPKITIVIDRNNFFQYISIRPKYLYKDDGSKKSVVNIKLFCRSDGNSATLKIIEDEDNQNPS